jgi:hypothetical protein
MEDFSKHLEGLDQLLLSLNEKREAMLHRNQKIQCLNRKCKSVVVTPVEPHSENSNRIAYKRVDEAFVKRKID